MKIIYRWSQMVLVVTLLFPGISAGEDHHLETFAQQLRRYHIGQTHEELVNALRHQNPEVRSLAAWQLADNEDKATIPDMIQALEKEPGIHNKTRIAGALVKFREPAAFHVLRQICKTAEPNLKLLATNYLLFVGDRSCFSQVIEIAKHNPLAGMRAWALVEAQKFREGGDQYSQEVFALLVQALEDPSALVRRDASSGLRYWRDDTAIPYMEAALAKERDESVRAQMQTDLQDLRRDTAKLQEQR